MPRIAGEVARAVVRSMATPCASDQTVPGHLVAAKAGAHVEYAGVDAARWMAVIRMPYAEPGLVIMAWTCSRLPRHVGGGAAVNITRK